MKSITTIRLSTLSLALVLGMSISASAQAESDDFELYDPVWRVNPADVEFLYDINDKGEPLYINQGGTVNRKTGNILIPTMIDGDPQIAIVDPSEGSLIGYMNMTEEVRGSDHRLHIIEVAATRDGQIFASNQVLSANLRIYYWADETADPIVVFNQAVEKPGGGDFSQWGKGLAVLGIGNDLTVLVSGFQNPNILVLNWNEGELEIENTFQTTPFSYGNGFAEIPGSGDVVWTNGIGVEASLFNYKTGELSASVDAGILSTDYNDIDYIETNLGKFLIAGPEFSEETFSVVDVTDIENPVVRHIIIFNDDNAVENLQLTGFVHFSLDGNAVVMSSNNPIMYFKLGITPAPSSSEPLAAVIPESFRLDQNYPNPFNPSTLIVYSLRETAEVTIDVFSSAGQRVATINEGLRQSGTYQVSFDASQLASGTYIYQLRAGDLTLSRSMTLVK